MDETTEQAVAVDAPVIKKVHPIKGLLTEKDNETHEVTRWITFLGSIVYFGLSIFVTATTGIFDPMAFGQGLGIIAGGGGVGVLLKERLGNSG